MSQDTMACVKKIVNNLEVELQTLENELRAPCFSFGQHKSLPSLIDMKEKVYAAAVQCPVKSCEVAPDNDEINSELMVMTLSEETSFLQSIQSTKSKKEEIMSLKNLIVDDETTANCEILNDDLKIMSLALREQKQNFETLLNVAYPELKEEIKEVLAMLEAETRGQADGVQDTAMWSPHHLPALQILQDASVIKKTKQTYKFNFKY